MIFFIGPKVVTPIHLSGRFGNVLERLLRAKCLIDWPKRLSLSPWLLLQALSEGWAATSKPSETRGLKPAGSVDLTGGCLGMSNYNGIV
ncbi:hypothetical protein HQ49_02585 [Porphyromonas gulae]|nr:hypothetical protein HQ49_02585 [Porphyromonas gulae]